MQSVKDYTSEEQLELYKAMLGAQPQSMFLLDKEKNIIGIFNAAPETMAGFTVDDIVGSSILKYAEDTSSPFYQACSMLNATFDSVFETGTPLKFQYMILDTCLEATITKISGDRILSQVRDVTEIVLKFKEIEQKKRKELSIALLAGGVTFWRYDVETRIISFTKDNDADNEDIPLDAFLLFIAPQYRPMVIEMFNDITSRKIDHEHLLVQMNSQEVGKELWMDVHAVPYEFSSDGNASLIIGSQKDVTKEQEYNGMLKKLNRQNALILNNTHSGFAYLTSDLRIEWENVSAVFSDREIANFFQVGDAVQAVGCCATIVEQAVSTGRQAICRFQEEGGLTMESMAQPVLNNDRIEGIVIRIDDVTEREQFVHELAEAKERAERSDKLKSAFLANMSHEIRTPLNSIVGFSQLLPEVESKEEQRSYIHIINSNSQVLLNLINDILDLSKIEAGYFTCNNEVFDLCELFDQLNFTFKDKVRSSVELICEIPEDEFLVRLDRMRVSQVISNFMTNALKFTQKGFVKLGFVALPDHVKLYVEDTGCGMSKEQISHVFERFEKFGSFEQGTGLGTSICKAIVDAYGGSIGVESVLDKGTTFWAILPINGGDGEDSKCCKRDDKVGNISL